MENWVRRFLDKEIIRYGIAGAAVTLVNTLVYLLFLGAGMAYMAADVISILMSKATAYFLNKFWVYKSKSENKVQMLLELGRFVLARGFTGLVDFFGLVLLVELCGLDKQISKVIIVFLVLVLNYVLGKKAVFVKK